VLDDFLSSIAWFIASLQGLSQGTRVFGVAFVATAAALFTIGVIARRRSSRLRHEAREMATSLERPGAKQPAGQPGPPTASAPINIAGGVKCPRCRADNRDSARFCRQCGLTFTAVCSGCGASVESGSKFCDNCGAPLASSAPNSSAAWFTSPQAYTPKHLAEQILTSRAALEGERKHVTVLFADLKGSMELLADRDPEEAKKIIDPVLAHMMEAVHRYEGTVNQVMGDGIMALFGAPLAHEDHAVRACYAALRMQDYIGQYAQQARRNHGVEVQIRVGLNSGRSWSARSAATCAWTTRRLDRQRIWRRGWSSLRPPALPD